MCTGAIILFKIPRVVIGENVNFVGGEALLKSRGVEVVVLDSPECKELMAKFIKEKPEVRLIDYITIMSTLPYKTPTKEWNEDIGEP